MASVKGKQAGLPVGRTIRKLRERGRMSQEELAEMVGFRDKSSISRIENGETSPTIDQLDKISLALGYEPVHVLIFVLKDRYPEIITEFDSLGEDLAELVA